MKKATVAGFSSNHKLIVNIDDNQNFIETRFEGFDISTNDIKLRPLIDDLLDKNIECSFNKNDKTIRYQNESLFVSLLEKGLLTVNSKELEQSKLYTSQQKKRFSQIIKSSEPEQLSKHPMILNDKQNSSILQYLIKSTASINARIQYLSEHMLVRFIHEGRLVFLKCKIENCKHYFQLFPQITFWKTKFLPIDVDIKIVGQKYNLLEKSSEVIVQLQVEIVERLIAQGWVALNQKNYYKNSKQSFQKLISIENESIKSCKGIYSSKSQILSFIYAKNNYVGTVTNIIEGYIYEITALKSQQNSKIQLPIIICPVGEDAGAFECREFARKQLIGKEVNVYLHKEEGLNTTGNIIRIEDWKDIESVMLDSGYAVVREEFKTSILGQKYSALENKAKQKKKGIHRKDLGIKRFEDLTQSPFSKAHFDTYVNRRLEVLSKLGQREEVIIQQTISSLTYKIRVESMNILISITLEGLNQPSLNPNLKEYAQIKSKSDSFLKKHIHQRTMIASISDYDEATNSFIGTLMLENQKTQVQEILIKACLVYADRYNFVKRYHDLQNQAKKTQQLIWQPQVRCFEPSYALDKEKFCFEGKFSWIHNGKVAYIQPKDNFATLEKLQSRIRELKLQKLPHDKIKIGAWCAAPYDGELYRAIIKQRKNNQVTVEFFDWGNQQIIDADLLKELPDEYLYIEKQCIKVSLNLVARTKNKQALQKVRQMLCDGGMYVFKKVYGDSVQFYSGETSSVNQELIFKGTLKADKDETKRHQNSQMIRNIQEELRKERVGIWEESDSSDEETEQY